MCRPCNHDFDFFLLQPMVYGPQIAESRTRLGEAKAGQGR